MWNDKKYTLRQQVAKLVLIDLEPDYRRKVSSSTESRGQRSEKGAVRLVRRYRRMRSV